MYADRCNADYKARRLKSKRSRCIPSSHIHKCNGEPLVQCISAARHLNIPSARASAGKSSGLKWSHRIRNGAAKGANVVAVVVIKAKKNLSSGEDEGERRVDYQVDDDDARRVYSRANLILTPL